MENSNYDRCAKALEQGHSRHGAQIGFLQLQRQFAAFPVPTHCPASAARTVRRFARSPQARATRTGSAAGELVFHVFGAIAHFERRLIAERTRDGIRAARARGKVPGRPALDPEKLAAFNRQIPQNRSGEEDDIKGPAVFLASDAAAFVTGHTLVVDGGMLGASPIL